MTVIQTTAVVARIKTAASAPRTYELVAPRDPVTNKLPEPPYAVVQPSDGTATAERFTGGKTTAHPRYVVHYVGLTYESAQGMREQVRARFVNAGGFGIPLTIAGETCKNLHVDSGLPVQVDNDVTPPLIYATDEISWDSEPTN